MKINGKHLRKTEKQYEEIFLQKRMTVIDHLHDGPPSSA